MIEGLEGEYVIADKGYDSDKFVALIEAMGMESAIPPRSHRKSPRSYDEELYTERNLAERVISNFKHYRRIARRFDKLSQRYLGFLQLVAAFMGI